MLAHSPNSENHCSATRALRQVTNIYFPAFDGFAGSENKAGLGLTAAAREFTISPLGRDDAGQLGLPVRSICQPRVLRKNIIFLRFITLSEEGIQARCLCYIAPPWVDDSVA